MESVSDHDLEILFTELYFAGREADVDKVLKKYPSIFIEAGNWRPLGETQQNFGVIENQQASPIASLIEKITNSIDAILMRRCLEAGIDPRSDEAPQSMEEAVDRFFSDHKNWDDPRNPNRREVAQNIQILADGPKGETSLIIYDNGEGQHPEDLPKTFLSLLQGNKVDIHFVQGKYNMGGSGAIVFCGKKRYQLIASRRYTGTGKLGFTLVREHPLSEEERDRLKNTWYEYFTINGSIPAFDVNEIDLGLYRRQFSTGTVIKLYSYDLPPGARSVISRDLNQSINEYLFMPALPLYTIDRPERYPHDRQLERHLFGLKRRLEYEGSEYVEDFFSEKITLTDIGTLAVTCYVFHPRVSGSSAKETKETLKQEFFKNNMSVLFSVNGQVHGHYTSEFITRTLKMNLLKNYLLIHVDCTNLRYEFRKELFMASRDRLKGGEESHRLRSELGEALRKSRLAEINKRRKETLSLESGETDEMVRRFADNLPLDSEMAALLNQVFKLDKVNPRAKDAHGERKRRSGKHEKVDFQPKRFPSYFRLQTKTQGEIPAIEIPKGGDRTIKFSTDVENSYFDRVEEPGELEVGLLEYMPNERSGGTAPGGGKAISDVLNVRRSSPYQGEIQLHLEPTENMAVGDAARVSVSLTAPGEALEQVFLVKVREPEKPKQQEPKVSSDESAHLGLPKWTLVAVEPTEENWLSWDAVESSGVEIDYNTVVVPLADGDTLSHIYINMDSKVWRNYRSSLGTSPSEEQLQVAQRKYIASVYFHTLFLYLIIKKRRYQVQQLDEDGGARDVDVDAYIRDVFQSYYADFLLNFSLEPLLEAVGD